MTISHKLLRCGLPKAIILFIRYPEHSMRVAIAGFALESVYFLPVETGVAAFEAYCDEIADGLRREPTSGERWFA